MRTAIPIHLGLLMLLPAALALPLPAHLTVDIVGAWAERVGSEVRVQVSLRGEALALGPGVVEPVRGSVTIVTPTPCWPDFPYACPPVLSGQTVEFEAAARPFWAAEVGPFVYPAATAGSSCLDLSIRAEVERGDASASARRDLTLCA